LTDEIVFQPGKLPLCLRVTIAEVLWPLSSKESGNRYLPEPIQPQPAIHPKHPVVPVFRHEMVRDGHVNPTSLWTPLFVSPLEWGENILCGVVGLVLFSFAGRSAIVGGCVRGKPSALCDFIGMQSPFEFNII
jgi:hypothetical protein